MQFTTLTLESVSQSATGATEFAFRPRHPLHVRAGQAGLLAVSGGGAKPFTLSSSAHSAQVAIGTSLASRSGFKVALEKLPIGGRARLVSAIGSGLVPQPDVHEVLIAQGIGITPFLSAARTYGAMDATLLQVGTPHWFPETAAAMRDAEQFGHRDGLFDAIRRIIAERPDARWSISGRADFVAVIINTLSTAGVPRRHIRKDTFWGMRATPRATPVVHG